MLRKSHKHLICLVEDRSGYRLEVLGHAAESEDAESSYIVPIKSVLGTVVVFPIYPHFDDRKWVVGARMAQAKVNAAEPAQD